MPLRLPSRYRRYWPVVVVLAGGLGLTVMIGWELEREAEALDRKRFALRIEEFTDQLDGRIEKTEQLLLQAQDYLMLTGDPGIAAFREWLARRGLDYNYPWVHGLAVATNRYRSEWRRELPEPVRRWGEEEWKAFQEQALAQPIDCVLGLRRIPAAGKKYLEDYGLRGRMRDGSDFSGVVQAQRLRISGRQPVMLDAQSNALIGVVLYAPVYGARVVDFLSRLNWEDSRRASARWQHLDSMILSPLDLSALVQAVWDGRDGDLGVEIFSSTNQVTDTWLNASGVGPRAADPRFKPYLAQRKTWRQYSRDFSLFFYATPLFEAQSPRRLARTAMAAGTGFTLLAGVVIWVTVRARVRQERLTADVLGARDALSAAEKERERLGHDLHDGAIQSLYAIQLGLTRTAESVESSLPSAARVLDSTRERVDEVIAELRRFIQARDGAGPARGTPPSLDRVLAAMVQRMQPTTVSELACEAEPLAASRLSMAQAAQLAQIARSALANAVRHGQPRHVRIRLCQVEDRVRLEVSDDGAGFDQTQLPNGGVGLQSMRVRAAEVDATLTVESQPGSGTRIVAEVPAPSGAAADAS